jgi:dihydropteroate synthase
MIIGGRAFDRARPPYVVGVVNLSPESPNQDSIAADAAAAVARARRLAALGADLIDLGSQSSWFEAPLLPVDEEIARLLPALRALKAAGFLVSVDTFRTDAAQAAIEAGADVLNDSDGFQDPAMIDVLARWGGPVILPFISGTSPHDPSPFNYDDPMADIEPFLRAAVDRAHTVGLHDLLLDPGTGYRYPGVSAAEKERYQVKVYEALPRLRALGHPLLVALPRKDDPARTLELVRMIVRYADWVRAHDPLVLRAALDSVATPCGS